MPSQGIKTHTQYITSSNPRVMPLGDMAASAQKRIERRVESPVGRCVSPRAACLLTCNSESGLAPMKFQSRSVDRQKTQKLGVMVRLVCLRGRFLSAPRHVSWPGARFICARISSRAAKETQRAVKNNGRGGESGQVAIRFHA